jgi:integral membrane protein
LIREYRIRLELSVFGNALRQLRVVGIFEGTSFLVLLGIAMPLKYIAQIPEVVLVVGWIHGLLWILYLFAALRAKIACAWSFATFFWAGMASVLPFGPFVFDWWLRRKESSAANAGA